MSIIAFFHLNRTGYVRYRVRIRHSQHKAFQADNMPLTVITIRLNNFEKENWKGKVFSNEIKGGSNKCGINWISNID
jgi:hypothetical protein